MLRLLAIPWDLLVPYLQAARVDQHWKAVRVVAWCAKGGQIYPRRLCSKVKFGWSRTGIRHTIAQKGGPETDNNVDGCLVVLLPPRPIQVCEDHNLGPGRNFGVRTID